MKYKNKNTPQHYSFVEGDMLRILTYQFTEWSPTGDEEPKEFYALVKQVEHDNMNDDWIHYHLLSPSQVSTLHWADDEEEWYINYHFDFADPNVEVTKLNENEFEEAVGMETYKTFFDDSRPSSALSKPHPKLYLGSSLFVTTRAGKDE
mgnify:FL=1|jgi:hypothetical protein|tara:strand:+ start:1899 stop:2345 length:447 start_codon:yes stop_codon:yes gene_type:complete